MLRLISDLGTAVVFTGFVGSCADIVATVVKPLLAMGDDRVLPSGFPVFVDSCLLLHWIVSKPLWNLSYHIINLPGLTRTIEFYDTPATAF